MSSIKIEVKEVPHEDFQCDQVVFAMFSNNTLVNRNDILQWNDFSVEEKAQIVAVFDLIKAKTV